MAGQGVNAKVVRWFSDVGHASVLKHDRVVDERGKRAKFVNDDHDRRARGLRIRKGAREGFLAGNVDARHRFVKYEEVRIANERPGDQYALLLPAGQFGDISVDKITNAERVERALCA